MPRSHELAEDERVERRQRVPARPARPGTPRGTGRRGPGRPPPHQRAHEPPRLDARTTDQTRRGSCRRRRRSGRRPRRSGAWRSKTASWIAAPSKHAATDSRGAARAAARRGASPGPRARRWSTPAPAASFSSARRRGYRLHRLRPAASARRVRGPRQRDQRRDELGPRQERRPAS